MSRCRIYLRISVALTTVSLSLCSVAQTCKNMSACALTLKSGRNTLQFTSQKSGYGVTVVPAVAGEAALSSLNPVQIYLCDAATGTTPVQCTGSSTSGSGFSSGASFLGGYSEVSAAGKDRVTASATFVTGAETFTVIDTFFAGKEEGTIAIDRTVLESTGTTGTADTGFNTAFSAGFAGKPVAISDYHFFSPAIWYDKNVQTVAGTIGTDVAGHHYFFWRETRNGLPLVMMQDPVTGTALTLAHIGQGGTNAPLISSGANEASTSWLVADSIRYGALGVQKAATTNTGPEVTVGFVYPAEEGDISYVTPATPEEWVRRSTPVAAANQTSTQRYTLLLDLQQHKKADAYSTPGDAADFHAAMKHSWRTMYDAYNPQLTADVSDVVMDDAVSLLNYTFQQTPGQPSAGFPFNQLVTSSDLTNYSFQMGYVGEQIPLASQLLLNVVQTGSATSRNTALGILNFWSASDPSAMQSNLPLAWYNPQKPDPANRWVQLNCSSPIFLRMVSDGMEGVVEAAIYARQHPDKIGGQPTWESFADQYAQWLVTSQRADGSFARAYSPDGTVWKESTSCQYNYPVYAASSLNSTFPIRFLVEMWFATKNPAYEQAALKAGAWSLDHIYSPTAYAGGITDSNTLDREAGVQAIHAAMALYDMVSADISLADQERLKDTWLKAAEQAATFSETWQYVWRFPVVDASAPSEDPSGGYYPQYVYAGSLASSISKIGASTSDIYMSIAAFDYYRLHLLTHEPAGTGHYGSFARLLANNTKLTTQLTNVPGQNFGWFHNGTLTEATDLANMRLAYPANATSPPADVNWVPWLTNTETDPEVRLKKAFGSYSVQQLLDNEANPQTYERYVENNQRIYPQPGTLTWTKP